MTTNETTYDAMFRTVRAARPLDKAARAAHYEEIAACAVAESSAHAYALRRLTESVREDGRLLGADGNTIAISALDQHGHTHAIRLTIAAEVQR